MKTTKGRMINVVNLRMILTPCFTERQWGAMSQSVGMYFKAVMQISDFRLFLPFPGSPMIFLMHTIIVMWTFINFSSHIRLLSYICLGNWDLLVNEWKK